MELKFITDSDKKEYADFTRHHFDQLILTRRKGVEREKVSLAPLYHYTTGSNLISVIESGELWTTQIACLNDTKELLHAVDLLIKAIEERLSQSATNEFSSLLNVMLEILRSASSDTTGIFVACFSTREDDLSQWRAYGGEGGGYAIKFDTEEVLKKVSEQNGYLVPVTYDKDLKKRLMDDIIRWSEKFLLKGINEKKPDSVKDWTDEFAKFWLEQLSWLAPLLKHEAFSDEEEWRLIRLLCDSDFPKLKFTDCPSMLRRHLPVSFAGPDQSSVGSLPISGVIVGPKAHQKVSKISVGDLLKSKGYTSEKVEVSVSSIPYRSMT